MAVILHQLGRQRACGRERTGAADVVVMLVEEGARRLAPKRVQAFEEFEVGVELAALVEVLVAVVERDAMQSQARKFAAPEDSPVSTNERIRQASSAA